jgi:hypothetical protein
MTGQTFLLFLFILLHPNEEERIAVMVRKKETGGSSRGTYKKGSEHSGTGRTLGIT